MTDAPNDLPDSQRPTFIDLSTDRNLRLLVKGAGALNHKDGTTGAHGTVVHQPSGEVFDLRLDKANMPEGYDHELTVSREVFFAVLHRRLQSDGVGIDPRELLSFRRDDTLGERFALPFVPDGKEVIGCGFWLNTRPYVVCGPKDANYGQVKAYPFSLDRLQLHNIIMNGLARATASLARRRATERADELMVAIDGVLPLPSNSETNSLAEIHRQLAEIKEAIEHKDLLDANPEVRERTFKSYASRVSGWLKDKTVQRIGDEAFNKLTDLEFWLRLLQLLQ